MQQYFICADRRPFVNNRSEVERNYNYNSKLQSSFWFLPHANGCNAQVRRGSSLLLGRTSCTTMCLHWGVVRIASLTPVHSPDNKTAAAFAFAEE
jgi:hypothetical protein